MAKFQGIYVYAVVTADAPDDDPTRYQIIRSAGKQPLDTVAICTTEAKAWQLLLAIDRPGLTVKRFLLSPEYV